MGAHDAPQVRGAGVIYGYLRGRPGALKLFRE
jgi:hypothetical protein